MKTKYITIIRICHMQMQETKTGYLECPYTLTYYFNGELGRYI